MRAQAAAADRGLGDGKEKPRSAFYEADEKDTYDIFTTDAGISFPFS